MRSVILAASLLCALAYSAVAPARAQGAAAPPIQTLPGVPPADSPAEAETTAPPQQPSTVVQPTEGDPSPQCALARDAFGALPAPPRIVRPYPVPPLGLQWESSVTARSEIVRYLQWCELPRRVGIDRPPPEFNAVPLPQAQRRNPREPQGANE